MCYDLSATQMHIVHTIQAFYQLVKMPVLDACVVCKTQAHLCGNKWIRAFFGVRFIAAAHFFILGGITVYQAFGNYLRNARRAKRLTQQEIADRLGVHVTVYAQYETGKALPFLADVWRISRILDVSADEMVRLAAKDKLRIRS